MNKKSLYKALAIALPLLGGLGATTSCSDMLETDSELVMFQEDNTLSHETDSVYSVMGIIHKMQVIADRSVLLGDIRSDLTAVSDYANADLKALSNFEVDEKNRYNQISDYYAVINNCNYFLANVDVNLEKRGYRIFEKEYAAVKAFRAWTYLQAVLAYGTVPLVTEPLLTENAAQEALNQPAVDIQGICEYFIEDLKPYVDVKTPEYGTINGQPSKRFFIPVRVLLGDLCLWAGQYREAATYYHEYLTKVETWVPTNISYTRWVDNNWTTSHPTRAFSRNMLSGIPMEKSDYDGLMTDLENIYCSTKRNRYYFQASPSEALFELSRSQFYCMEYKGISGVIEDTIYAAKEGLLDKLYVGDLRLNTIYSDYSQNVAQNSNMASERQCIDKYTDSEHVKLYSSIIIYLHFAEALNRAGFTQSAFAVLKYGLQNSAGSKNPIDAVIDKQEREEAGILLDFSTAMFTEDNTQGIHARGCGDAHADKKHYSMPMPDWDARVAAGDIPTRQDTIAYQQPLVEELILNELAFEGMFEGNRYYDLMRVALRNNDPAYLADKVARRNGTLDAALREKLMNKDNWFLPKQ